MFDLYNNRLNIGDEVVYVGGDNALTNGIITGFTNSEVIVVKPNDRQYSVIYRRNRFYKIK